VVGTSTLSSYGVSQIAESITNATFKVTGGGVWCLSTASCDAPGSLTGNGTFWDELSGNGTANQSFLLNGQAIPVVTYGSALVFGNIYNSKHQSVSVGDGALVGNSQTRECGRTGDPPWKS
jgi:hypothetical protein